MLLANPAAWRQVTALRCDDAGDYNGTCCCSPAPSSPHPPAPVFQQGLTREKVAIGIVQNLAAEIRAGPTSSSVHLLSSEIFQPTFCRHNYPFAVRTLRLQTCQRGGGEEVGGGVFSQAVSCDVTRREKAAEIRWRIPCLSGKPIGLPVPASPWTPVVSIAAVSFPNGIFFFPPLVSFSLFIFDCGSFKNCHCSILFDPTHPADEFLGQRAENTSACVCLDGDVWIPSLPPLSGEAPPPHRLTSSTLAIIAR